MQTGENKPRADKARSWERIQRRPHIAASLSLPACRGERMPDQVWQLQMHGPYLGCYSPCALFSTVATPTTRPEAASASMPGPSASSVSMVTWLPQAWSFPQLSLHWLGSSSAADTSWQKPGGRMLYPPKRLPLKFPHWSCLVSEALLVPVSEMLIDCLSSDLNSVLSFLLAIQMDTIDQGLSFNHLPYNSFLLEQRLCCDLLKQTFCL